MIIAEVSDKMMSYPTLAIWCLGLILASYLLEKRNRWLLLIPTVFALVFALGSIEELKDPHFSKAVIHELGYGYILLGFAPATFILTLLVKRRIEPNQSLQTTRTKRPLFPNQHDNFNPETVSPAHRSPRV